MGGRLGEIALSFKPKDDGLSLEKIVDMVDQSFEKDFGIKIRVLYLRFWFSGIAHSLMGLLSTGRVTALPAGTPLERPCFTGRFFFSSFPS